MAKTPETSRHAHTATEPAQGFYDLGMYNDAWEALDELPISQAADFLVISLRLDILLALHRLDDAVALGIGACRIWPRDDSFILRTVSALMALDDFEKAKTLLVAGPDSLRTKAAYWYDLARCQGRAGETDGARKSLWECINRDKSFRGRALDDPDLDIVWKSLS